MKITQVQLGYLNERMVCWLPNDKVSKFKPGMILSLKGQPRLWDVIEVYSSAEHYELNKEWKVGGL